MIKLRTEVDFTKIIIYVISNFDFMAFLRCEPYYAVDDWQRYRRIFSICRDGLSCQSVVEARSLVPDSSVELAEAL